MAGALVPVGDYAAMAEAIDTWLDRTVPNAIFEQAVAPYRVQAGACAYLRELGFQCPASKSDE
jgi:hypothetical protein